MESAAVLDSRCRGIDDLELHVAPRLDRLEEALAHIFAEELARQEGMSQRFMQALVILALIELEKGPVQEIAGLTYPDREVTRAHIEEMQWMIGAIGHA